MKLATAFVSGCITAAFLSTKIKVRQANAAQDEL